MSQIDLKAQNAIAQMDWFEQEKDSERKSSPRRRVRGERVKRTNL